VNPVPLVYCRALVEVEQLGMTNAVGDALDPVKLETTVFAAIGARSWIGFSVVAIALAEKASAVIKGIKRLNMGIL
jgi:hypothetical protein